MEQFASLYRQVSVDLVDHWVTIISYNIAKLILRNILTLYYAVLLYCCMLQRGRWKYRTWKWRTKYQDLKMRDLLGMRRALVVRYSEQRERHDFDRRVRRVRRRLFRHFWLPWSLPASTAWRCGSGAMRTFSLLWQLHRHCRIRGPWLPDMPHTHSHGASVRLNVHWVDRDFFTRNMRNTVVVF